MIIILKDKFPQATVQPMIDSFTQLGLSCHFSQGTSTTIIGLVGDTSKIDIDSVKIGRAHV